MSKEAVLKVKEAEDLAQKILQDANARARAMVDAAEKKAESDCEEYERELTVEYKERVEQVRTDAEALADKNRQETMADTSELEASARENMNDAVKIVMRRIISECQ